MSNQEPFEGEAAVGLFDILGFKDLVNRTPLSALRELTGFQLSVSGISMPASAVNSLVFSDSILVYSRNHRSAGGLVVVAASNLLRHFASGGVPLRGALTYGEVFIDPRKHVFVGKAIVRAYELEQQQEWMGAVIDPQNASHFGVRTAPGEFYVPYAAPMKTGRRETFTCVGWTGYITGREVIDNAFQAPCERHEVHRKWRNTIDFFDHCAMQGTTGTRRRGGSPSRTISDSHAKPIIGYFGPCPRLLESSSLDQMILGAFAAGGRDD